MKLFKMKIFNKKIKETNTSKNDFIDKGLIRKIQTLGGITFKDQKYVITGEGYESCIHIYDLPQKVNDYWLSTVSNINDTISVIDISTDDIIEVRKNLNKSMSEQESRYDEAKKPSEKKEALIRYKEMDELMDEIESYQEIVKLIHIRIYVADRTLVGLEEKLNNIMINLQNNKYKPTIFMNETKNEWMSLYRPFKEQQEELYSVAGHPITAKILSAGNPFNFSELNDKNGDYLGTTPCNGNVIFYEFTIDEKRKNYNAIIVGESGSGKSTFCKKRFKISAISGNFVRAFDLDNEYTTLTYELGGRVIKLDGSDGILNPLEILKADENDNISFMRHISKVTTLYHYLVPTATVYDLIDFEKLLKELYEKFDLSPSEEKMKQITGLPPKRYPIFSDLLILIDEQMENIKSKKYTEIETAVVKKELLSLEQIRKTVLVDLCGSKSMFNGYTTFGNILEEKIVTFDLSTVKDLKSNIFDAIIFNTVSLSWDNCISNGKIMKEKYEKKEIEFSDIVRFTMIIDEAHRWLNAKKTQALELITLYEREARKYFGNIYFATQKLRDFVPEGSNSDDVDKLKTIFELTQYKFIFQQDVNSKALINTVFADTFTQEQIQDIPYLQKGNCYLAISGDRTIKFMVYLSEQEKEIFKGGL